MFPCKLCQTEDCSPIPSGRRRTFLHCSHCGLVFVPEAEWPSPQAERARYDHHDNTPANAGYLRFLHEVVARVEALNLGAAPILDFGCGEQAVLTTLLSERGFTCDGYDPLYGRDRLGGPYGLVILCEVIEHIRDLRGELTRLSALLHANGKILVRTRLYPSVEQIANWWYSRDLTHINFFAEETIGHAARLAGKNAVTRLAEDMFVLE